MESGQRGPRKGRKLGSSRRRQTREPADSQDTPGAPELEFWTSQAAMEVQSFLQDCGAQEKGFITREDLAVAKFSFLGSDEDPQRIFDWVDMEQQGHLSLDEFSSGLKNILGSSQSTHRLSGRRPRASLRRRTLKLEEADAQEKEAFSAFMKQWGTNHSFPDETEIWQLWRKLRQGEPQLAGNLEGFLAKMSSRLQEARAHREVLELNMRKCDSDHHRKVQQLYEEMEQQLRQEKQQLQVQSESRDSALNDQIQAALKAKDHEMQRLVEEQRELEAQLRQLSGSQQQASSEQRQLREAERDLAGQLEEVQGQLRVTRRHLTTARAHVSWQIEEKPRDSGAGEQKAAGPAGDSLVDAPLPGVFGDNEDWGQLLNSLSSSPQGALQISWSPPVSPKAPSASPTPRVVRQISISETHTLPLSQGPPSESNGGTSGAEEVGGTTPPGQHSPLKWSEKEPEPSPLIPGLLEATTEPSGSLVAATLRVLVPVEGDAQAPGNGSAPLSQTPAGSGGKLSASQVDDRDPEPGPIPAKPPRLQEVSEPGLRAQEGHTGEQTGPASWTLRQGLEAGTRAEERDRKTSWGQHLSSEQGLSSGRPESTQSDSQPAPLPIDGPPTQVEIEGLAPRRPAPSWASPPKGTQPGGEVEPKVSAPSLPTATEPEAPPRSALTTAETEGGDDPPRSRQPEDPRDTEVSPAPVSTSAREPVADPDFIFHIIFLGDSNVGKTSFLHLLHYNSFITGLAATVGMDFRVKNVQVDNKNFSLQLWDTAGQERYHSVTRNLLRKADGVVLMYDVTSWESFAHVRYWLDCLQDAGCEGVAILLLGNKTDCEEARQVPPEAGQQLAQELGASFGECSAALGHNILEPVVTLARSLKVQEDHLKDCLAEVTHTKPPKKAGCCS